MSVPTPDVKSLFGQALEIAAPAERAAFLDRACSDNPALRAEVESLLLAHNRAADFLQQPASPLPGTIDHLPPTEGVGAVIGPYKLLQQIGEGGMGTVFMAEQTQPIRRKVALKIIKPGMDSKHVLARFEAERQALALMDHQNIARVLDAGATTNGLPYFVMELVHGVPITRYCDENKLTARQRLELFVPVCQAVQHAHQKGVIHRDLKPSNILVTLYDGKPVPKVIDFGVAKAIEQPLTEHTLFTQFGAIVGTLEYMAPEQAEMSALGVDTRSDVYSLGVLLYELLTGATPLERSRLKAAGYGEIVRLIKEEEPPRPSARLSSSGSALATISQQRGTEPRLLVRQVRGELDWIALKALEKDRTRRYESASSLARDVERHLREEPVEACPPSAVYRLRKFARKHRSLLVTATAFAMLLLTATGLSLWLAVRANQAEAGARNNEKKARDSEQLAQKERDEARAAQERLRRTLYGSDMNLVQAAWEADNVGRVVELLDRQRPREGETDLRGFEWHYWRRLSQGFARSFPIPALMNWVSFDRDGRRLAVLSPGDPANGEVDLRVLDPATGRDLSGFVPQRLPHSWWEGPLLSPDGRWVAVAYPHPMGQAGKVPEILVRVWEVASARLTHSFSERGDGYFPAIRPTGLLAFVPEENKLLGLTRELELTTGQLASLRLRNLRVVKGFNKPGPGSGQFDLNVLAVKAIANPNPNDLASALTQCWTLAELTRFEIHNPATGRYLTLFAEGKPPAVCYSAVSADGKLVCTCDPLEAPTGGVQGASQVHVWNAITGKRLLGFTVGVRQSGMAHLYVSDPIALSPNGKRVAVCGSRTVVVHDTTTGELQATLRGHVGFVTTVCFSEDGNRLYTFATDQTLKVWDLSRANPAQILPLPGSTSTSPSQFTISEDGSRIALAANPNPLTSQASEVILMDRHGRILHRYSPPGPGMTWTQLSANGERILLTGSNLNSDPIGVTHQLLDVARGEPLPLPSELNGSTERQAVLSPDGKYLVTFPTYLPWWPRAQPKVGRVTVWHLDSGKRLRDFELPFVELARVCLGPEGRHLYHCGFRDARIWDVSTGKQIASYEEEVLQGQAFSQDGRRFAQGSSRHHNVSGSGRVNVWDLDRGDVALVLDGLADFPRNIVFSPDGRRLLTTTDDDVQLWDVSTGHNLLTLIGNQTHDPYLLLQQAAFTVDGNQIVLVKPGQIQVFDATPLPEDVADATRRTRP